jgi:hypothetical protein
LTAQASNLLQNLHRWATAQDENFTTDAFAHLLRHLVSEEPDVAAKLLARLTGQQCWASLLRLSPEVRTIEIVTQDPGEEGKPDITIKAPGILVCVEVKVESSVDPNQLEKYRLKLKRSEANKQVLVLLTQKPVNLAELPPGAKPDIAIRWFQVGEWLDDEFVLGAQDEESKATAYLVRQFSGFLKARRLVVDKISWQLSEGVRSLVHLMEMLRAAVENSGAEKVASRGGMEFCGHDFTIGGAYYWAGLYYSKPETLIFSAFDVNEKLAKEIGHGLVKEWVEKGKDMHAWWNQLDLGSEEVHFFARTKSNQIQCIEQFLKESIEAVAPSLEKE